MQKEFWERSSLENRRLPSHPVVSLYTQSKLHIIFEKMDLTQINNVLDIGCGNGFFTVPLNKRLSNVVGLDFSRRMLSLLKQEKIPLIRADSVYLPFKDRCFDLVFCANMIHHVNNQILTIEEIKRVAKKYIVIIEPNKQNPLMFLLTKFRKEEDLRKFFFLNDLKALLKKYNLTVLDSFSIGSISPNQTPLLLAQFLKNFDSIRNRFGLYNVIICEII